jgi:hypothetical protein
MDIIEDILPIVSSFLDDKSFIIFIHTKRDFIALSKDKPLINEYKMSQIMKIKNKYIFTNILYNFKDWKENIVPLTIKYLRFANRFNHLSINNVTKFFNLKQINIGYIFVSKQFIINLPDTIENKNYLKQCCVANFLTNNFLTDETMCIFENKKSYQKCRIIYTRDFFSDEIKKLENMQLDQKNIDKQLNFNYNFKGIMNYTIKELLLAFNINIEDLAIKELFDILLNIFKLCYKNIKSIEDYFLKLYGFESVQKYNDSIWIY